MAIEDTTGDSYENVGHGIGGDVSEQEKQSEQKQQDLSSALLADEGGMQIARPNAIKGVMTKNTIQQHFYYKELELIALSDSPIDGKNLILVLKELYPSEYKAAEIAEKLIPIINTMKETATDNSANLWDWLCGQARINRQFPNNSYVRQSPYVAMRDQELGIQDGPILSEEELKRWGLI